MNDYRILMLKNKAYKLQRQFIERFHQTWNLRESVEELAIQIGHLSQSIINNGKLEKSIDAHNQPNRILEHIKDELCDCFLSICSIYIFFDIKKDEETCNHTENKDEKTLIVELAILAGQLLDSCLIIEGIKPSFKRDERKIFLHTYFTMVNILETIAKIENMDIEHEFDKMITRTLYFLEKE